MIVLLYDSLCKLVYFTTDKLYFLVSVRMVLKNISTWMGVAQVNITFNSNQTARNYSII